MSREATPAPGPAPPPLAESDFLSVTTSAIGRNEEAPAAGPFERPGTGDLRLSVWPWYPLTTRAEAA
jgi:hypothetical protein